MTVMRKTEYPLASAEVADDVMDGAYAVHVTLHDRAGREVHAMMSADEAGAFTEELQGATAEAINTYRTDNPPAPFAGDLLGDFA